MFKIIFVLLAVLCVALFQGGDAAWPWPQPDKVLAYWPFSSQTVTRDMGPNNFVTTSCKTVSVESAKPGPFGDSGTSVSCPDCFAVIDNNAKTMLAYYSSFTIAFFYYANGQQGGLLTFDNVGNGISMYYTNGTDLVLLGMLKSTIGRYKIMQRNIWTFVAVTFNYSTGMLAVYGKHGLVYGEQFTPDVYQAIACYCNNQFTAGWTPLRAGDGNSAIKMASGDMMSCLSIYKTALTPAEIQQLHDSCRQVTGSTASGQPRLPYGAIPDNKNTTTMLKPGQMPWMVSVRNGTKGEHLCTASIYSEYFLITSLACAKMAGSVIVGEHDVTVTEKHEERIQIKRTILFPGEEFDVALIELLSPISSGSEYVNNLEVRSSPDVAAFEYFVAGWGENGRSPYVSSGLPRYSYGKALPVDYCAKKWQDLTKTDYDATKYVCMYPLTNQRVPCHGDEGSPLLGSVANFIAGDHHLMMFGVFSKRDEACSESMPGFYANVMPALPWIKSTIACLIPGAQFYPDTCPLPVI